MDKFFPPKEVLLELEPEEIAQYLLAYLQNLVAQDGRNKLNRGNNINPSNPDMQEYSGRNNPEATKIAEVLSEGWAWLESEGFLVGHPEEYQGSWVMLSRRARAITTPEAFKQAQHIKLIPKGVLDPQLAQKVWSPFIRGDFELAIFAAFKEVEVRIRTVAELPVTEVGVALARKAFHPRTGPLTDTSISDPGEKQAHSDLFAGALGSFKNPSSHRDVDYTDPVIAASLILHANTLIKIIENRKNP